MLKKLITAIAVVMLVVALPAGAAFGLNSPNLNSPNLNSPNLNSPNLNSPNLNSPNLNSPNLNSPNLNSPNLNSPNLNSPNLNSPNLNSPNLNSPNLNSPNIDAPGMDAAQGVVSNVAANSIVESSVPGLTTQIAETGAAYAPAAGAFNLLTIAGVTAIALFGAVGAAIALVVVLRRQS